MARINLLPWRETRRQQRRKDFLTAGGVALGVTLGLAVVVHLFVEAMIDAQVTRNRFLEKEIAELDLQIKEIQDLERTKEDLLARMDIIQRLQKSRPEIVRLFDELVTAIPEGLYLTKIEQRGRSVVLEGRAQSNARVSALMSNVERSDWISKPRLMLIENKDKTETGLSHFRLAFNQSNPEGSSEPLSSPPSKPEKRKKRKKRDKKNR